MVININDLEDNFNPHGTPFLSGRGTVSDSLRELLPEELKTSGGEEEGKAVFISNKGGYLIYGDDIDVFLPGPSIDGGKVGVYGDNVNVYEGSLPDSVYISGGKISFNVSRTNSSNSSS